MVATLFVFDKSGSMSWGLNGRDDAPKGHRRIDYAKNVLLTQLGTLSDNMPLGLIVFPHVGSCDVACLAPIFTGQLNQIVYHISHIDAPHTPNHGYNPHSGGTPLATAIDMAGEIAQAYGGRVHVIIITDGEETCGGDPSATAYQWHRSGLRLMFDVIGYAVDKNMAGRLEQVASAGGGRYYNAQKPRQLKSALSRSMHNGITRRGVIGYIITLMMGLVASYFVFNQYVPNPDWEDLPPDALIIVVVVFVAVVMLIGFILRRIGFIPHR